MVAIFTGAGAGLERGSGLLGSASFGRSADQLFLNAANGNLMLSRQDEFLVGKGADIAIGRTYNSLGNLSDENGDNWRQSGDRRIFAFTGTVNAAGSSVKRRSADGSEISYTWNGTTYLATEGDGAYDTLYYTGGGWVWTDGSTGTIETYESLGGPDWQIIQQRDTLGNIVSFSYTGDKLTQIATADGSTLQYQWSGNNITGVVTGYTDLATGAARTLTRTRYAYDGDNRLTSVTVDLSPGDNSIADGKVYVTSYTYHGASKLLATLTQTDGTRLEFGYTLAGGEQRLTSIKQWVDDSVSRTTRIDYDLTGRTTIVTDPAGVGTRFTYDAAGRLTRVEEAAAAQGGAERISLFAYDSSGNVTWARTYDGAARLAAGLFASAIAWRYDANGNVAEQVDGALNTISRTWSATNRLLTETRYTGNDPDGINGALPAGAMTTRFVYDGADRLIYSVSAEGRVTAYQYVNDTPVWVIDYPGHVYDVSGLAAGTALTASQLATWAAGIADRSSTQVRQNSYDARGNLVQTIDWGAANPDGSPSSANGYKLTRYVYDQAGKLLARTVAGTGQESFVYDGLGRLISSTDANGATTLTLYRDGTAQVDTVTIPAGGNLVDQTRWPDAGTGAQGPNLVDNSHWPEEERGPNLVDLSNWPGNPDNVPGGIATLPGWNNGLTAETQWASTIGPDGLPTVVMHAGQSDSVDQGGGSHSNLFAIDSTKAYEFSITFQVTELNKHRLYFGLFSDGGAPAVLQAQSGAADSNPYFTTPFPGETPGLVAGRWYKIVGYVLPQGSENVAWGSLGGIYDVETGTKLHDVTNFRWNENRTSNNIGVRFFNFYSTSNQGYFTNFYSPEARQLNFGSGAAQMPGWNTGYTGYIDETRWARTTGPDGKPVWAMQAGQTDSGGEGGGAHTSAITVDGRKAYEFTYYFKKSDLSAHSIYFGAEDNWNGGIDLVQAWDGTSVRNPYFFSADASWQQQNLTADRWYKVVGYVFAEGTQNIDWNAYGGVYDTVTGARLGGVSNYRWTENLAGTRIVTRFFDYYDQSVQGYSTYFYKPEVREFAGAGPAAGGYAEVPGWPNPYYYVDETGWANMAGPDGRPVTAIQAGQTDPGAEGGGNHTNDVTIDPARTYEFSLYFQLSETDRHRIYVGLSGSGQPYVLNHTSGAADGNPYFTFWTPTAAAGYQPGRWYKIVGYVLPQGTALGPAGQHGGIYDVTTGQKIEDVTTFQWSPNRPDNQVHLRFFNYYDEATQGKYTYFYGASIRPVDDYVQSTLEEATLVHSERYNRAGELVSLTESGRNVTGGTAYYTYDEAGRLKSATDFRGYRHHYLYDRRGRKTADIAADGSIIEYRYDAEGRQVASVRYYSPIDNAQLTALQAGADLDIAAVRPASTSADLWTWNVHDADGRVVEAIEGDGSVTAYEYDGAGRLVRTTGYYNKLSAAQIAAFVIAPPAAPVLPVADAARDSVARSFFDKQGLLVAFLDGEGYLTRTVYDNAGQVIETVAHAAAAAAGLRAAGTLDQLIASAGNSVNDRHTRFVHDGQGLLRYEIDALGGVTEYGYGSASDAWGVVRQTTRYAGSITLAGTPTLASVASALTSAGLSGAAANRTAFNVYDQAGQVIYTIDAEGAVIGYGYDDLGRVVRTVRYADLRATATLPSAGDMDGWGAAHASAGGNPVTRNFYNGRGDLLYTIDAEGYVVERGYDADGRLTRVRRYDVQTAIAEGATAAVVTAAVAASAWSETQTVYDAQGRVSDEYDALGTRTWYWYRANGELGQISRATGTPDESLTWRYYDGAGRLASQYEAAGSDAQSITSYAWDGLGNLVRTIDARGNSTWNYHDRLGRVTATRDAENYVTETGYTAFGEVETVTRRYTGETDPAVVPPVVPAHARDATTRFEYDKLGRVRFTTDAEGGVEQSWYNAFGEVIQKQNKLLGVTQYGYDRRGLLVHEWVASPVYDAAGNQTASGYYRNYYRYDARGNLLQRAEALDLAERRDTYFTYDKADRLILKEGSSVPTGLSGTMVTPAEHYTYDKHGNLVETWDTAGGHSWYWYDDLDRKVAEVTAVTATQGSYTAYEYDDVGNLASSRAYDGWASLPTSAGGMQPAPPAGAYRETSYGYDALNRLTSQSVAGQATGWWQNGSYVYTTGTLTTTYQYDAAGNVVKTTDPAGASVYSYYDKLGRKSAEVDALGYLTTWERDTEGNVTTEQRWSGVATGVTVAGYTAPSAVPASDRVTNFSYDRMGNRLTETRTGVVAWTVNATTGQLEAASTNAAIAYAYNALGQVRTKTEANGDTTTYTYDSAGRLIQESRAGFDESGGAVENVAPTVRYYYNGLGDLVRTRQGREAAGADDRITQHVYGAGGRLLSTVDAAGATREYSYDAAGRVVAEAYRRLDSGGVETREAIVSRYDLAGQVITQTFARWNGSAWVHVDASGKAYDATRVRYNAHGEVTGRGITAGPDAAAAYQETFDYDSAGRLWRSNAGDGVLRFFLYDKAGNQTLTLTSAGADLSGLTLANYAGSITAAGGTSLVNAVTTVSLYSARGELLGTRASDRLLASGATPVTITGSRTYNAFGEVASETDARGYTTSFTYNTMGRLVRAERPTISITLENGTQLWVKPSEDYYYDISGRLIGTRDANGDYASGGTSSNGTSKAANTGSVTTRTLLAGTGHGGSEALVVKEFHPDGTTANEYDVFGDLRKTTDALNHATGMAYDKLGRLTEVTRPGGLVESYRYDVLGQRTRHWTSFDTSNVETTDYDTQGRVVRVQAFGGDVTTTSYEWSGSLATLGLGTFGGWIQTTSTDADRASASDGINAAIQQTDMFGHLTWKRDAGGNATTMSYDLAGRVTAETGALRNMVYSYYNTGQTRQVISGDTPLVDTDWSRKVASYEYDALGQLTREQVVCEQGDYTEGRTEYSDEEGWHEIPATYFEVTSTLQDGRAEYDAAGRITRYRDVLSTGTDAVDKKWTYDAVGNVRSIATAYLPVQANGLLSSTPTTQTWWYRYDSMNRVVTTKGTLAGVPGSGTIERGSAGTDITYDAAGERKTAQTGSNAQEVYSWDDAGRLTTVVIGGVTRAQTWYDLLGRVSSYAEYDASGVGVHSRYGIVYDQRGLVLAEKTSTKQGSDWIYAHTVNNYSDTGTGAASPAISSSGQVGTSSGSLLYYSETKNWKNGSGSPVYGSPGNYSQADLDYADSYTSQSYLWRDSAMQSQVALNNRDGISTSRYFYDRDNGLTAVIISGGSRPRTISYTTNLQGQVIARGELDQAYQNSDPYTRTYMFGGRQMGVVSNDGTGNVDYATSIAQRTATPGSGAFRNGATSGTVYADFDANFTAFNGGTVSAGASSYIASAGETLQSIAAQLWGDSALWYLLAEANGLSGSAALAAGTPLTIPGGVIGSHNNATTFKPYDPAAAIGNTSPNTPRPPSRNNCGAFGAILMVAVAVAVTAVTAGAAIAALAPATSGITGIGSALGALASGISGATGLSAGVLAGVGAVAGAVGSIASQGVGIAIGAQKSISWKGVAIAGVAGGISGGLAAEGVFANISSPALQAGLRGALGNVIGQGIGLATRLQSRFDFAGVAVAGAVGAASGGLGKTLRIDPGAGFSLHNAVRQVAAGTAGALAGAATRSVLAGTGFGDNVLAALPEVIGSTVGNMISGQLTVTSRNTGGGSGLGRGPGAMELRGGKLRSRSNFANAFTVHGAGDSEGITGWLYDFFIGPLDLNGDSGVDTDDIVVFGRRTLDWMSSIFGGPSSDRIAGSINNPPVVRNREFEALFRSRFQKSATAIYRNNAPVHDYGTGRDMLPGTFTAPSFRNPPTAYEISIGQARARDAAWFNREVGLFDLGTHAYLNGASAVHITAAGQADGLLANIATGGYIQGARGGAGTPRLTASSVVRPGAGAISTARQTGFSYDIRGSRIAAETALPAVGGHIPNAGGVIRQFTQQGDQVYYRVFSGDSSVGSFLTAVPPRSSAYAREALALPPGNQATFIQEVLVPNGTPILRSRALPQPAWGRTRGGAEQFELLKHIPTNNFGPGRPLP